MHGSGLNPALLLRLNPPLLLRLAPSIGLLLSTQGVALLLRPSPADRRLRLHGPGLRHGRRLRRLHWVGLLTHGCTHRCRAYRARESRGDFCRLAAHEFFHRDLPVTVHIGRGVEARGLFQIGAGGFCQFFDGQAARLVLVGREEALFVRHRFRFRFGFVHRLGGWLGCHHGTKGSGEGIGGRLVLPSVVELSDHGFWSWGGIAWRAGKGNGGGTCWKRNGVFRSR